MVMRECIAEKVVRKELSTEAGQKELIDSLLSEVIDGDCKSSSDIVN